MVAGSGWTPIGENLGEQAYCHMLLYKIFWQVRHADNRQGHIDHERDGVEHQISFSSHLQLASVLRKGLSHEAARGQQTEIAAGAESESN